MKAEPLNYRYRVCPKCSSKKLRAVALTKIYGGNYRIETAVMNRTGYLCENCSCYSTSSEIKYKYDRAEMKRDRDRLTKFLETGEK